MPVIAPARLGTSDEALGVLAPGLIPAIAGVVPAGRCVCEVLALAETVAKPLISAVHAKAIRINRSFIVAATRRSWLSYTLHDI
jgi:hypothetical protein